jgi:hypothetical protein
MRRQVYDIINLSESIGNGADQETRLTIGTTFADGYNKWSIFIVLIYFCLLKVLFFYIQASIECTGIWNNEVKF